MSYNPFTAAGNAGLGIPTAGYASRGKANGLKRLSVAAQPKVGPINEDEVDNGSTPARQSRLNMLSGLRTAPRTPSAPASAPFTQTQHNVIDQGPPSFTQSNIGLANSMPHTAIGSTFTTSAQNLGMNPGQQFYSLPDQVMTPPAIQINEEDHVDPAWVQLCLQQQCLNQRAQLLQYQMSMFGVDLSSLNKHQLPYPYAQSPVTPQMSLYQAQLGTGIGPIEIEQIQNQSPVYAVYNPLTAQYTTSVETVTLANSPPPPTPSKNNPFKEYKDAHPNRDVKKTSVDIVRPASRGRPSMPPIKEIPSQPDNVQPLPPKSANAWRPGHRKQVTALNLSNASVEAAPKSATLRSAGMPGTPTTGTFGPGHHSQGDHPIRQPTVPPNIDELRKAPTTKFKGSKNFATRSRKKAVSSLVRAGFERSVVRGTSSTGSMTPVSETELTFSVPSSDNDTDSIRSGSASLSGEPSPGFPPNVMNKGVIGSERKASKGSIQLTPTSESSDSGFVDEEIVPVPTARTAPLRNLRKAAEKRKSGMY